MKFISVQTHHCCITYSLLFNSKAGCIVYCTMGLLEIKIVLPDWCSVPVTLVRQYSLLYEFEHILFFLKIGDLFPELCECNNKWQTQTKATLSMWNCKYLKGLHKLFRHCQTYLLFFTIIGTHGNQFQFPLRTTFTLCWVERVMYEWNIWFLYDLQLGCVPNWWMD